MNFPLDKALTQNNEKILKPDFSTMSGREFLATYLHVKLNHILEYDSKSETPIFQSIKPNFLEKFTKRLIHHPEKHILIGISGESASGKTTICNKIQQATEEFNMPIEILSADNYFKDISELINKFGSFDKLLESGYDVDSPNNFDMEQLYEDLKMLSKGEDVKIPQYLVNGKGIVIPHAIPKKAQKIIVVEGMATMYGEVSNLFDIKIYVDIEPSIQEKWFLYRAQTSRNQNEENARKQLAYVREASKKYILPKKDGSDIIINGASSLEYFNQIIKYIYKITNNFSNPN
jgi:uridine kinase